MLQHQLRSFVSFAFTPFIDIAPAALNTSYEVELADGKVVSTNTVLRGSFDVNIGMDRLSYHRGVIDYYEKFVCISLPNGEILEVHDERPKKDPGSLACIKADEKKLDDIRIPSVGGIRKLIMDEAHTSRYSVHPGADKMYYDLRDLHWWPGMKRDIAEYVSRCLMCAKIKVEHQKPSGLLQQPEIFEWKREKITMDLDIKLPRSSGGYDGVVRFGKKGKLAPRYVGPFEIAECVRPVAYRLKLPEELSCIHNMFHMSNLKKCLAEPDVQVHLEEIEIDENLHFVKVPIEIVEHDVKKLKRRRIPLVKVCWNSRQGAEYIGEREDQF
nr:retrotransposon protein, putative, Ty3-gypsy subclass [Tanacetum cinerariifolium]